MRFNPRFTVRQPAPRVVLDGGLIHRGEAGGRLQTMIGAADEVGGLRGVELQDLRTFAEVELRQIDIVVAGVRNQPAERVA